MPPLPVPLTAAAAFLAVALEGPPCGAAEAPRASVSRTAVAFARVPQGYPSPVQPVFVTNVGDGALVVTALSLGGEAPEDFRLAESGTCRPPATLGAGERCRIDVVMTPLGSRGASATLTVETTAASSDVALTGAGDPMLLAPILASMPGFLDFPAQVASAPSAPRSLTITNTTRSPLALGWPALLGGDATDFSATTDCPMGRALPPGRSCAITVTFTPRASGPRASELAVEFDDGAGGAGFYRYSITGIGGE